MSGALYLIGFYAAGFVALYLWEPATWIMVVILLAPFWLGLLAWLGRGVWWLAEVAWMMLADRRARSGS
jgi:hypothetical protein